MTSFSSKPPETYLPKITEPAVVEPDEPPITSIWNEVPYLQGEKRLAISPRRKTNFAAAFGRLDALVRHPVLRLKPIATIPIVDDEHLELEEMPDLALVKERPGAKKKLDVESGGPVRPEYTKEEIENMLKGMEQRLTIAEQGVALSDQKGQNDAIDEEGFATLHKKYEVIRADLIEALNS
jgi:hypothetical protein